MIGALIAKKKAAAAFEALNRHDLARFMSNWREDGVFIYPGDLAQSGTYQGKAAVEAWFRQFLEQFPTIAFEVQDVCARNLFDLVGTNVLAVHWTRRVVNREGYEVRDSGVTIITGRWGKVAQVKDFFFDMGDAFRRMWGGG
ncbi:MAG: nuclear transport factor 2 family protein [Acidimicrobiia bacterium]|nr:nuclear transport factor 2 family protein [Acidimicrobiia bacterium]